MTINEFYRTSDFQEAIYLRKSGIIFIKTEWATPQRAVFVFRQPSDDILSAWQTGNDSGVRVILDAADFFRGELRGSNR